MDTPELLPEKSVETPAGLLLTGEGLGAMTPERFEMLAQMVGGLGLELSTLEDITKAPIPIRHGDFLNFATDRDFTQRTARAAWLMVERTALDDEIYGPPLSGLPALRYLDGMSGKREVLDLRGVRERLKSPRISVADWREGSVRRVGFLRALVTERVGFDGD